MGVTTVTQKLMDRIDRQYGNEVAKALDVPYDPNDILMHFREFCDHFKDKFDGPRLIASSEPLAEGEVAKVILRSPSFDNDLIERRELSSGDGWGYNPAIDYSLTFVETEHGVTARIERIGNRFNGDGWSDQLEFYKHEDGYTAGAEVGITLDDWAETLSQKYQSLSTPGAARRVDGVMPYETDPEDSYDDTPLHSIVFRNQWADYDDHPDIVRPSHQWT